MYRIKMNLILGIGMLMAFVSSAQTVKQESFLESLSRLAIGEAMHGEAYRSRTLHPLGHYTDLAIRGTAEVSFSAPPLAGTDPYQTGFEITLQLLQGPIDHAPETFSLPVQGQVQLHVDPQAGASWEITFAEDWRKQAPSQFHAALEDVFAEKAKAIAGKLDEILLHPHIEVRGNGKEAKGE